MFKLLLFHLKRDIKETKVVFILLLLIEISIFLFAAHVSRDLLDTYKHAKTFSFKALTYQIIKTAIIVFIYYYFFVLSYNIYNKKLSQRYKIYNIIGLKKKYIVFFCFIENLLILLIALLFGYMIDTLIYKLTIYSPNNPKEYFRYNISLINMDIFILTVIIIMIPIIISFSVSISKFLFNKTRKVKIK
ncbi:MAG: hypothetical protein ACTTID_03680 [Bacillales bacterium]